jgi:hypothetical protein
MPDCRSLLAGTAVIALTHLLAPARMQTSFAGVIADVACTADLKETSGQVQRLPKGRDLDLPVSAGEQVQCTGAGDLSLALPGELKRLTARDKWFTIREGPSTGSILGFSEPRVTRAPVPLLFSPAEHGIVRAEHATIRWRAAPDMGDVTFTLRVRGGTRVLCCKNTYSGSTGRIDAPELREAFRSHRGSQPARELRLTMRERQGDEHSVEFFVLSAARDAELLRKLTRWSQPDAMVRHLGRASVFTEFRLMDEAWLETQEALKDAPNNPVLMQLAARAANRAQDIRRADELLEQLKAIKRSP